MCVLSAGLFPLDGVHNIGIKYRNQLFFVINLNTGKTVPMITTVYRATLLMLYLKTNRLTIYEISEVMSLSAENIHV